MTAAMDATSHNNVNKTLLFTVDMLLMPVSGFVRVYGDDNGSIFVQI